MTEKDKKPYIEKGENDKKRMEKEKADLEKKGYFILEDGSKSTDEKNLPSKIFKKGILLPSKP